VTPAGETTPSWSAVAAVAAVEIVAAVFAAVVLAAAAVVVVVAVVLAAAAEVATLDVAVGFATPAAQLWMSETRTAHSKMSRRFQVNIGSLRAELQARSYPTFQRELRPDRSNSCSCRLHTDPVANLERIEKEFRTKRRAIRPFPQFSDFWCLCNACFPRNTAN